MPANQATDSASKYVHTLYLTTSPSGQSQSIQPFSPRSRLLRVWVHSSMCEPMRRPAPSLTLLEKEHAYTREYEDADAGVHRERVVDHEQRATEYRRDHPASAHIVSSCYEGNNVYGTWHLHSRQRGRNPASGSSDCARGVNIKYKEQKVHGCCSPFVPNISGVHPYNTAHMA